MRSRRCPLLSYWGISLSITTFIRRAANRPKLPAKSSLRADIQGLRAFAVIVVILDHLFHWPSGGFVGVDIFFVISGFVITQSMLREHARTGRVSIAGFYKRRVKRIMPAALLTLIFTLAGAYFVFGTARFITTVWDALIAAVFGANYRFALAGTDYFQADGPISPLQHFWSLSVEEQFYGVWPWIVAGVFLWAARAGRRETSARNIVGLAIIGVSASSLAWALWETAASPTWAYFNTASRVWELGIGSVLAIVAPACSRIPATARPVLAWVGVMGMILSLFVINPGTPFPAPAALLPVLSAALFILAGTGSSLQLFLFPFTNRVSGYIGNMSYSLYLWHFPIIVLTGALLDTTGLAAQFAVLAVIFAWSYFAYELWEKRIQDSNWLTGKKRKTSFRTGTMFTNLYKLKALTLLAVVTLASMALVFKPATTAMVLDLPAISAPSTVGPAADKSVPEFGPAIAVLQSELATALKATSWPNTVPTLGEAPAAPQAPNEIGRCGKVVDPLPADECTFGSGASSAMIVGDSIAQTYSRPLIDALDGKSTVEVRAAFACPFSSMNIRSADPAIVEACPGFNATTVSRIRDSRPDTLFIAHTFEPRTDAAGKTLAPAEWASSISDMVKAAGDFGGKVVVIAPAPSEKLLAECYSPQKAPSVCVTQITEAWTTSLNEAGRSLAPSGTVVDTRSLYCVEKWCPSFAGGTPVKSDKVHITVEYGGKVTAGLRELLIGAGI